MSTAVTTFDRDRAVALDAADPLASFRGRYLPQSDDVVAYLDGNSLGRPLESIASAWSSFASEHWAGRLIRGWSEGWMELPEIVGDELASAALGAAAGQTVIADSTTVNFYKAMRAALNLRPDRRRVILDRDNFPTNRYAVESLVKDLDLELVWLQAPDGCGVTPEMVAQAIDDSTAVLTLSHIAYQSGYLADMRAITEIAHDAGAVVVWDLCHSVGSTEIFLDDCRVDFAVGCTYKFVGAGPGAPAFVYVNRRHHDLLDQPIWGWLGRADSFEMEQGYVPARGIRSMRSGTPPIPAILAVREGAAVIAEAGIGAIRAKAVALTDMVVALTDEWLVPQGFSLGSPRESALRGGHVSVNRPDAREVCARLIDAGVLADFRAPSSIRIGLSPLPTGFAEVWDAMDRMRELTG